MITQFLHTIQSALKRNRPQTRFPSRFAQQGEFIFANDFSPIAGFAKSTATLILAPDERV